MQPTIFPLQVITTLLAIPGLGESKARTLLRNFGSIEAVATASEADLSLAIGSSAARAVAGFLGKPRDEAGFPKLFGNGKLTLNTHAVIYKI